MPLPMTPLLAIRRAGKAYAGVPALIDVDLDLYAGEVHALLGENGAGKSTLIRLLAGVTPADQLDARLEGRPVNIASPGAARALGFRFIHQELNDVPGLSVAENIFLAGPYPRWAGGLVDWRALNAAARDRLARLGVTHIAPGAPMGRLRPGDRMLVKIAGVMGDADDHARVYVMDEPTAALSRAESERLFAVIAALKAEGAAVLYVSHRLDEIFAIADRATVLRDGRVVATMPIGQTTPAALIAQMTGRALDQLYPMRAGGPRESVVLRAERLSTRALHAVDFALRAGEILGVAGLAGSGRAELLRAVLGADRRTGGRVLLGGRVAALRAPARAWGAGLGYTPEERRAGGILPGRGVGDNIALPHLGWLGRWGGWLTDARREAAAFDRLGALVRLKATGPRQPMRQLSGGNQQKALFARALAAEPQILLLDEPTRGVDVGAKLDLYRLIAAAADDGVGVLLASSDLGELLGLCDRVLILRGGRVVAETPTAGLTQADLLALCYGEFA